MSCPNIAILKIDSYVNEPKFYTGNFDFGVLRVCINFHLKEIRYFTSAPGPLIIKHNWMSGQVVRHHKQNDKAHGPLVIININYHRHQ